MYGVVGGVVVGSCEDGCLRSFVFEGVGAFCRAAEWFFYVYGECCFL